MKAYSHDDLLELAAAYALGATAPEETAAIDAALPNSPELEAEVAAFREVTALMAEQQAMQPPPALRDRLLDRIRADGRSSDAAAPAAPSAPTSDDSRARLRIEPRELAAAEAPRRVAPVARRVPLWLITAFAATLIIAAGLTMQNVALRRLIAGAQTHASVLQEHVDHREKTLNALLEAEKDLYIVHLKGADTVTGPGIQFFWNQRQHLGVAHAFRLTPAPAGRDYQLWVIVNGRPVSMKVFNSDPDGHALVEGLAMPATITGATDILLTIEPKGGSPLPTAAPVLKGTMAKG